MADAVLERVKKLRHQADQKILGDAIRTYRLMGKTCSNPEQWDELDAVADWMLTIPTAAANALLIAQGYGDWMPTARQDGIAAPHPPTI